MLPGIPIAARRPAALAAMHPAAGVALHGGGAAGMPGAGAGAAAWGGGLGGEGALMHGFVPASIANQRVSSERNHTLKEQK